MDSILNDPTFFDVKSHSPEELDRILSQSVNAFQTWKHVPLIDRAELMYRFADVLEKDSLECAQLITREMGKVIKESRKEIEKCISTCIFYAEKAEEYLSPEIVKTQGAKSYISYHPLGPVLAVMPWNFPFWQVIRFAAPAIMAGNTGLLKHASNVPGCAIKIEELFKKAGYPEGIFQAIFIEGRKMDSIIKDSRISAVTITGSEGAGSKVAEAAGKSLKKTVLELGGSDPFIVLEDADLDLTTDVAVKSRMVNTGQSCIAAKRFIIVEKIADSFVELFKNKLALLKMGEPFLEETDYGPLAKLEFAYGLQEQVNSSVEKGARVILGGNWSESDDRFFPATILVDVKPGMPAYEEELFGPVASIIVVKDEVEALRVANDTKYGLGASIWTRDIPKAEAMAAEIEAGIVCVNKMVASDALMPFGGIKMSGYGRELSYLGIREFTNIKTVNIA